MVSQSCHKVLLADDQPMVLEGLKKLLAASYDVVGAVKTGSLLEAAERLVPDLVVTDLSMPYLDGVETLHCLRESVPTVKILVLSIHTESSWVRAAFNAGANGYLAKTSAPDEIEDAVRQVLNGRLYVCPAVAGSIILAQKEPAPPNVKRPPAAAEVLTRRELEVVRLVGRGLCNKEIAQALGLAVNTVRSHLNKVYDKLEPGSRVGLALYAASGGESVM